MKPLLAIETSCDECSAAVILPGEKYARAASNVIFSQVDLHRRFGGVVPEVASRNHLEMVIPVVSEALANASVGFKDLGAVAVTSKPGLIGALLVGVSAAKSYAYALNIPLIAVDHLEGHLHSLFLENYGYAPPEEKDLPLLCCLVSGGHTNLYLIRSLPPNALDAQKLSESRDDAAGEAFDKCAKLIGLPYPGGIHIDKLAKSGDKKRFELPRPLVNTKGAELEFSFSGLKTAVSLLIQKQGFIPHVWGNPKAETLPQGQLLADLSASIQEAIVDTLMAKIESALKQTGAKSLAIVGGVSANSRLRERLTVLKIPTFTPRSEYCTDNAAMIGAAGYFQWQRGETLSKQEALSLNAVSS